MIELLFFNRQSLDLYRLRGLNQLHGLILKGPTAFD
jgi:hypothetical protein